MSTHTCGVRHALLLNRWPTTICLRRWLLFFSSIWLYCDGDSVVGHIIYICATHVSVDSKRGMAWNVCVRAKCTVHAGWQWIDKVCVLCCVLCCVWWASWVQLRWLIPFSWDCIRNRGGLHGSCSSGEQTDAVCSLTDQFYCHVNITWFSK